jgi:hypothetical protein
MIHVMDCPYDEEISLRSDIDVVADTRAAPVVRARRADRQM